MNTKMDSPSNFNRRAVSSLLSAMILILFSSAAQAQTVIPQTTCVAPDPDDATRYIAYFGYTNTQNEAVYLPSGSSSNYFYPVPTPEDGPFYFLPGIHRKILAMSIKRTLVENWELNGVTTSASFQPGMLCGGSITYQGKLLVSNAAANGRFDMKFRVFDALDGGTAQSEMQTIYDVTVTNGVFTIALDGDLLLPREQTGKSFYLEISVKQGNTDFTTLVPRQPLTATPYAVNAISAALAVNATNAANAVNAASAVNSAQLGGIAASEYVRINDARLADARPPTAGSANYIQNTTAQQTSSNFNISGSGTLGGDLSANRVNTSSPNNMIINANSSSTTGSWLTLNNTSTGGRKWSIISTGAGNGEGAGKMLFYDQTNSIGRLQLSDAGVSVTGNLIVSGSIGGTISNATNAINATNVSGGFVQLPLTTNAPPPSECDEPAERGRMQVDAVIGKLYICIAAGWKSATLQ